METDTKSNLWMEELGTDYSKMFILETPKPKFTVKICVGMWQMTLGKVLDLLVSQFIHLSFLHLICYLISSSKRSDLISNIPFGSKVLGY